MKLFRYACLALALITLFAVRGEARQDSSAPPPATAEAETLPELTAEEVAAGQAALETASDLSAEDRAKATADYAEALERLGDQSTARAEVANFEQEISAVPGRVEELRGRLDQAPVDPVAVVPRGGTLKDIQGSLDSASTAAESARQDVEALKAEASRRAGRQASLPEEITQAREKLGKAREALAARAPEGESIYLGRARTAKVRARIQAADARLSKLQAEQRSYKAREESLQLRRDVAQRDATQKAKLVTAWEATASEYRRREASETKDEAQLLIQRARQYAALGPVAETYSGLVEEESAPETGLNDRIDEVTALLKEKRVRLAGLREEFEIADTRYRVAGGTYSMGELLRRETEALPDERQLRKQAKLWRETLIEAELRKFDLENLRGGIGDVPLRVSELVERREEDLTPAERAGLDTPEKRARFEQEATALFRAELERVDQLLQKYRVYSGLLFELGSANLALAKVTDEFRAFIDERILWVRSVEKGQLFEPKNAGQAFLWLVGVHEEVENQGRAYKDAWGGFLALALALALAIWARRYAIRRMADDEPLVGSYRTDSIRLTFMAMLWTGLVALPVPLVLFSLSWIAGSLEDPSEWEHAWTLGFQDIDLLASAVFYLQAATRAGGLCETHFRWTKAATSALRRDLRWLVPFAVTAHFIIWVMLAQSRPEWNNSLGRGTFVVAMLGLSVFTTRSFLPSRPVLSSFYQRNPGSPVSRLRYLWPVLAIGFPLGNALIACLGYYFSAINLESAVGDTMGFTAVTVILYNLGLRWLFVVRRRMTVEQALRRREKANEESQKAGVSLDPAVQVEPEQVDIPAVDAQTRSLLRAAVVLALLLVLPKIWGGIVPSLHYFDRVQLWPQLTVLETVEAEELAAQREAAPKEAESEKGEASSTQMLSPMSMAASVTPDEEASVARAYSMTLADLGLALVLAAVTILSMRNVPGLLEITLLKRLSVDAGSRYAFTTIARYLIGIVGTTAAFNAIHIGWDTVKWLAAALTFGLAFGLQEIFANFISGLIILLERPVRVGDTVTVGTVEGVVSRIRMRATTVVDWDNREFLVPNKNLITGEVTNWTLSDSVTRIVFAVGVAYGSDTKRARELLVRAATDCPHVMQDPAPSVLFRMFGASALEFQLRTYIPTRSVWADTINIVNSRIDELFRAAGIEIAFNQLDLHIRDVAPTEPDGLALPKPGGAEG